MANWAGKFIIGLTGNIATGKSVIRRMLEHLGAYGIDADALAHRAIARDAPGYQPVIELFGRWILEPDGQINRSKLASVVFNDDEAMARLEAIVHPLVSQAVNLIVSRAAPRVVVIEAIKLLESDLRNVCNSIWVTYTPPEIQLERLINLRGMSPQEARQRIEAQSPQEQKVALADVVIKNSGTFAEAWRQVTEGWKKVVPAGASAIAQTPTIPVRHSTGELVVVRGKPRHSAEIAEMINRITKPLQPVKEEDVMAEFGEKAFLLVQRAEKLVAALGWQVENLVARASGIVIEPSLPAADVLPLLIAEMERASKDLQCEVALVYAPNDLAKLDSLWHKMGYLRRTPQELSVQEWQEAARESVQLGTTLFFKQLRQERVLRPI